jgi:hypothetical protein
MEFDVLIQIGDNLINIVTLRYHEPINYCHVLS